MRTLVNLHSFLSAFANLERLPAPLNFPGRVTPHGVGNIRRKEGTARSRDCPAPASFFMQFDSWCTLIAIYTLIMHRCLMTVYEKTDGECLK